MTITLDDNAAGWSWDLGRAAGRGRKSPSGRIDLLSALVHEVGHLLGYNHAEGGAMAEMLALGARQAATDPGILPSPKRVTDLALAGRSETTIRLGAQSTRRLHGQHRPTSRD